MEKTATVKIMHARVSPTILLAQVDSEHKFPFGRANSVLLLLV